MLCQSIGEAEFNEVILRHLHLFIDHLLDHVVVFVVIDGRIDEKINNKPGNGGDGGHRHGVRVECLDAAQKKITLEFKCDETHHAPHRGLEFKRDETHHTSRATPLRLVWATTKSVDTSYILYFGH